ncbi:50S ribosomal protein L31 [Candidatus Beckwithbacteria bacterium CG10_big_fil_rev_8_21_14_0_10_34_10]|uniref:Large ribosomal subunit protein bL31 n=1 Tax=Candidatus Beckwithbacteria bacterium CG10_big_fil_rev_8_21_14_0_10_34_10 TaxID=1974495 RepID=A0A2H0W8T9_9BACT|nr:MAG: 50S ribosomal protein L31 [Candidatus Beckwithbacteria bacterium CG10_big_fil_rev_8_21_14_0_10_34_10]
MKKKIHPIYYNDAKVICACGNTFVTGSTLKEIKVEICSACHPFFTGEMKYVDTLGRVEKFKNKQDKLKGKKFIKKSERKRIKEKIEDKKALNRPKSLKEMLQRELKKEKK